MNLTVLKKNYGISAKNVTALRSNVAVVETEHNEKTIIKRIRRSKWSNWLNKHRFLNELRIYKVINKHHYNYLNAPKLINFSNQHMILQYVERDANTKTKTKEFLQAYYEMQTLDIPKNSWFDFKNQIIRGFFYKGVIVPIFTLSKQLEFSSVLKIVMLYLKLELRNKSLKRPYWLHGDLTTNNVYHNIEDGKLYFLDYENLIHTHKWPLFEIIHRCYWLKDGGYEFIVDTKFLKNYLTIIEAQSHDIGNLYMKDQFRFSILLSCINNLAIAKSKIKKDSFKILLDIVLSEEKFENWYVTNIDLN